MSLLSTCILTGHMSSGPQTVFPERQGSLPHGPFRHRPLALANGGKDDPLSRFLTLADLLAFSSALLGGASMTDPSHQ